MSTIVYAACECVRALPTRQRIKRALADLARHVGSHVEVTQADIAAAADCRRETASRELARLERAGVIRQGRGWIDVLDVAALETTRAATPKSSGSIPVAA